MTSSSRRRSAAASLDLSAAGTATLNSGSTVTIYGDITTCDVAQSSTSGFAPGYARRKGGNLGVWYWLNNTVGNTNSAYLASDGGTEATGGGGKGTCSSMLPTHSTDTIVFDNTDPDIIEFTTYTATLSAISVFTSPLPDDATLTEFVDR